jgi:lipase
MTPRGYDKSSPHGAWQHRRVTPPLHTDRFGPAETPRVLLVHGLTGYGRRWESLATNHLSDVSMLAADLLGHGRSSWDAPWTIEANVTALGALLDAEGGSPVVVVGHSFGGAVALNLAATRPDLVSGLVLLDPAVGLDGGWMRQIADEMFRSPDYTDRAEARADKLDGSWSEVDDGDLERELDEHLVDLANGRVGWRISLPAAMSYWSELSRPALIPRDGTPTTVVRAKLTQPPYVTEQLTAGLEAALGADFTLHEWDCNHMVPLAMPAETAALIRTHLG